MDGGIIRSFGTLIFGSFRGFSHIVPHTLHSLSKAALCASVIPVNCNVIVHFRHDRGLP